MPKSQKKGKRILITGAGSGIGKSCAEHFLEKGYRVALIGRRKKLLETVKNGNNDALPISCNVSEPKDVQDAFELVEDRWGGLDVLFNNAGIEGFISPLENYDEEMFDKALQQVSTTQQSLYRKD